MVEVGGYQEFGRRKMDRAVEPHGKPAVSHYPCGNELRKPSILCYTAAQKVQLGAGSVCQSQAEAKCLEQEEFSIAAGLGIR